MSSIFWKPESKRTKSKADQRTLSAYGGRGCKKQADSGSRAQEGLRNRTRQYCRRYRLAENRAVCLSVKEALNCSTSTSHVNLQPHPTSHPIRAWGFMLRRESTQRPLDSGHHVQLTAKMPDCKGGAVLKTELINDDCHPKPVNFGVTCYTAVEN